MGEGVGVGEEVVGVVELIKLEGGVGGTIGLHWGGGVGVIGLEEERCVLPWEVAQWGGGGVGAYQ